MTIRRTPFDQACHDRGWIRPAIFLAEFAKAARLIGEPHTITDRQFRRWRAPNPPRPHPRSCRVLHAMFGVPPTELGFPPSPHGEKNTYTSPTPINGAEETDVKRRAFVTATVGTAAVAAAGEVASSTAIGTAHIEQLRAGLTSLRTLDNLYGSRQVLPLATQHLNRIRKIITIGTYPESLGRQLHQLEGDAAAACAWLNFDYGNGPAAQRHWGEAMTTAGMLGDTRLETRVLAMLGMQANHERRPRQAYGYLQAARQRAETLGSPILLSVIATREAVALAQLGDHALARGELARAMRLYENPKNRPAPAWTAFHGPAELNVIQARLYVEAGRYKQSSAYYQAALPHMLPSYSRNHAHCRLRLANTLLLAGEADEGASQAITALNELTDIASGRIRETLHKVHHTLTTIDAPAAKDAAEAISARLNQERPPT